MWQHPGLFFSFIKYMQNWWLSGVLKLDIIFYEANPELQKNALQNNKLVFRKSRHLSA